MKGGMEKIRRYYGVPAKRGLKVQYCGRSAIITSGDGQYLRLRFEDATRSPFVYHPLYEIDYLDGVDYNARFKEREERFHRKMKTPSEQQGEVG